MIVKYIYINLMAGYLVVFTGPMFGRKTTEGLGRVGFILGSTKSKCKGKQAILINHSDDTRDLEEVFSTHDPLLKVNRDKIDMVSCNDLLAYKETKHNLIMVDEFQFFDQSAIEVVKYWISQKKYVVVAGLIAYSNKKKFGFTLDLMLEADEFEQVRPDCPCCTEEAIAEGRPNEFRKAPFTTCLVKKETDKLVGGAEKFAPSCRRHHVDEV